MDETATKTLFVKIDTLTAMLDNAGSSKGRQQTLFRRAVALSSIQNYESAIDDLTEMLQADSTAVEAWWLRAVCQARMNAFHTSQGTDVRMLSANVVADLSEAIQIDNGNAFLYYNRANIHVMRNDLTHALEDYSRAIAIDGNLADAYYNRGLTYLAMGQRQQAQSDFSKAGELGLYDAYSLMKKNKQ